MAVAKPCSCALTFRLAIHSTPIGSGLSGDCFFLLLLESARAQGAASAVLSFWNLFMSGLLAIAVVCQVNKV